MAEELDLSISPNDIRRRHGLPEHSADKEDRTAALHFACLTVQDSQALEQKTTAILHRAEKFFAYIKEGTL